MHLRPFLAATALFLTQPATAGITAHYRLGQGPEQRLMVVEVNDRGDSRTDRGDGQIMLVLGGVAYVVTTDADGTYVARLEDVIDGENVVIAPGRYPAHAPRPVARPLPPRLRLRLVQAGAEIVGGRRGTVWRVVDPAAPANASAEEFVVSLDPDLAMLRNILGPRQPTAPDPALDPNGAATARWTAYRQGTILREGRYLQLERVEIRPIPEAFALPGPVPSREALIARAARAGR